MFDPSLEEVDDHIETALRLSHPHQLGQSFTVGGIGVEDRLLRPGGQRGIAERRLRQARGLAETVLLRVDVILGLRPIEERRHQVGLATGRAEQVHELLV